MIWAVKTVLSKYVTFSGRARRAEYWWWVLFTIILSVVAGIVDAIITGGGPQGGIQPLSTIVALGLFLPGLAVLFRRLHDTDRSGWWWLILFIPLIGLLVMIYFLVQPGTDGSNRFGEDPTTEPMA